MKSSTAEESEKAPEVDAEICSIELFGKWKKKTNDLKWFAYEKKLIADPRKCRHEFGFDLRGCDFGNEE